MERTPLLSTPLWLPHAPIRLDHITLRYTPAEAFSGITGTEPVIQRLLPTRADGSRYRTYSEAVAALAAPTIFENRSTYRLLRADLQSNPHLVFSDGKYFDGIDLGDAAAHEFTAAILGEIATQDLRTAIGDPCDPARRLVNVAIGTLTLRYDRTTGAATFPLHRRDGARVGHAGGMYQVLPVGVFQPAGEEPWNTGNDFSLWRCIIRELAEELRGDTENYDTHRRPFDYGAWPFADHLTRALDTARVRAFCLGIGVDPLTFATDILTVVTIDAPLYDDLFGEVADANAEGSITPAVPFTAETVERYASNEPTQAAGAGLLRLAWQHRSILLD
ncbi:MAG: transcriptional regulator [Actinomycetota bacterium]|nr:transcriptional regulator [Actinomycetota bacterium]